MRYGAKQKRAHRRSKRVHPCRGSPQARHWACLEQAVGVQSCGSPEWSTWQWLMQWLCTPAEHQTQLPPRRIFSEKREFSLCIRSATGAHVKSGMEDTHQDSPRAPRLWHWEGIGGTLGCARTLNCRHRGGKLKPASSPQIVGKGWGNSAEGLKRQNCGILWRIRKEKEK